MAIQSFDHIALPAHDAAAMIDFYRKLGFTTVGEQEWRDGSQPFVSLALDDVKINLHDPKLWQNERFTLRGPTALARVRRPVLRLVRHGGAGGGAGDGGRRGTGHAVRSPASAAGPEGPVPAAASTREIPTATSSS